MKTFSSINTFKPSFDTKIFLIGLISVVCSILLILGVHMLLIGVWIASFVYLILSNRNNPDLNTLCKISLKESSFLYQELDSEYQVEIEFNKIISIETKLFRNIDYVIISIKNNFELTCINLDNQDEFVNLARIQANL